jgi:hypothetical protein
MAGIVVVLVFVVVIIASEFGVEEEVVLVKSDVKMMLKVFVGIESE